MPFPSMEEVEGLTDTNTSQSNDGRKRSIDSYYSPRVGLCQTASLVLNAGLMIYAHLGLSGVILSSFDPSVVSSISGNIDSGGGDATTCNERDREIWTNNDGQSTLPAQMDFCIRTYNGGCLANATCTQSCFEELHGYSDDCAACFGSIPPCGMNNGCTFLCIADSTSPECLDCLVPCFAEFLGCSRLPTVGSIETSQNETVLSSNEATGNSCNSFDLAAIETWYNLYNITFIRSIRDTWNNGAKFLACIIVFFSGVWPYAKNILLLIIWYTPLTVEKQTAGILWLSWLSKYTLVDVFAVIGILVLVQLQLSIGGVVEAVIRVEPRFGILCFFLATVWEFVQIEVIKTMHERKVLAGQMSHDVEERVPFSQLWTHVPIILASIGLYVSGTVIEFLHIRTSDYGSEGFCMKSYNIVQLGNALINEVSMTGNSAAGQTWFLYLVYVALNLALPILTHLMQIIYIIGRVQSERLDALIQWASAVWCFACIEVLLIGIFAIQSKFDQFILNVAGVGNEDILDIKTGLGNGFYILIAYSVVACALQFSLAKRHGRSANVDEKESNQT